MQTTPVQSEELDFGGIPASHVRIKRSCEECALTVAEVEVYASASCPAVGETRLVPPGPVTLEAVGQEGGLCTLAKRTVNSEDIIPLARSYDYAGWGNAPGEVAHMMLTAGWNCHSEGGTTLCKARLPDLGFGEEYVLTTYSRSITDRDRVSRFISAATFGVTPEDLDGWDYAKPADEAMFDWVQAQMNETEAPPTSLREFWRHNIINYVPGTMGPGMAYDICTSSSRWRNLAFAGK